MLRAKTLNYVVVLNIFALSSWFSWFAMLSEKLAKVATKRKIADFLAEGKLGQCEFFGGPGSGLKPVSSS